MQEPVLQSSHVSVIPLTGITKQLGYRVPETLKNQVSVGSLVRVPLRNRSELAVVASMEAPDDYPVEKLKYISGLEQPFPVLTQELLQLGDWMCRYYGCGLDSVLEVMIPAAVRRGMKVQERLFVSLKKRLSDEELQQLEKRAPKQARVYHFLNSQSLQSSLPKALILKRLKVASAAVDGLIKKGIVEQAQTRVERTAYEDHLTDNANHAADVGHDLTEEQAVAVENLDAQLQKDEFKVHLLHGVTGSGKTEVYLTLVRQALDMGGGVVFLVPEVALTPQTVGRLRARLEDMGVKSVVWHSHLSDGERFDAWHELATGQARVVVGARSAVFAPVKNLKLIIVDEEHEPAYKQEDTPRYHGRDVAVYRAHINKCLALIGSATPSLESLYNVSQGKYAVNHLRKRVDDRQLPTMHVIDMRYENKASEKGRSLFSRMLIDKMQERFEKKEQTILFLNRRGYNTSMMCPDCGYVAMCHHCDVTLTYHRTDDMLRCHLCGHEEPAPKRCPKCGSPKIRWRGTGTQRIEEITQKFLPGARIVRIDADAMQKKDLFREILGDFRQGKIDVLVGTQMIAKGLDFPNVTLVGLVDADITQHLPDFRSAERTFQLLVQVSGRAGRGVKSGEVVVQTCLPDSAPIQYARKQDFDGFAEAELEMRKEFSYPPYQHLVHHLFRGRNLQKVEFFAQKWAEYVEDYFGEYVQVRGPAEAPVTRIKDQYRQQIWYFVNNANWFVPKLVALRNTFTMDKDVIDILDVDAVNLM